MKVNKIRKLSPKLSEIKHNYFNPRRKDEGVWICSLLPPFNLVLLTMMFNKDNKNIRGIIIVGNIIFYSSIFLLFYLHDINCNEHVGI